MKCDNFFFFLISNIISETRAELTCNEYRELTLHERVNLFLCRLKRDFKVFPRKFDYLTKLN